jgi:hypothetical protein
VQDCTHSKTLSRDSGLRSRASVMECAQSPGAVWKDCGLGRAKKRQRTARTPKRYRATRGSGSRASVMECAQSPGAVWKNCGLGRAKKRQRTARTPKRYRATRGSGSRASVLECVQSPGAVWKDCGLDLAGQCGFSTPIRNNAIFRACGTSPHLSC